MTTDKITRCTIRINNLIGLSLYRKETSSLRKRQLRAAKLYKLYLELEELKKLNQNQLT